MPTLERQYGGILRAVMHTLAVSFLMAASADARTWRVARDGAGDFIVVAEAVAAAASGDTISIASGVYPEIPVHEVAIGPLEMVALVSQSELTIIGDDRESVILGADFLAPNRELGHSGIVVPPGSNVRVRGVTVRNSSIGVDANGAWVDVDHCSFVDCWQGVRGFVTGMTKVQNCYFEGQEDAGVMVFEARGGSGAIVENCEFVRNGLGIDFQPLNCIVRDSVFDGQGWGSVGVQVSFGGSARIERCTFRAHDNVGVGGTGGSQVFLDNCAFEANMPLNVSVSGLLVGSGNHLGGGTWATLEFNKLSTIDFHGNHILNAGGWSVRAFAGPEPVKHFDLSGNYWGTTSTAQIDEWITDYNDRPWIDFAIVDYLPLADHPIPTDESSMGRLKSSFRER